MACRATVQRKAPQKRDQFRDVRNGYGISLRSKAIPGAGEWFHKEKPRRVDGLIQQAARFALTPEGLERSRRANWKYGYYSREAEAERSRVRAAILALRDLCGSI